MSLDEFAFFIPARARRSLKRGFTSSQKALMRKISSEENNLKTHSRNMVIIPPMLDKVIKVYNGKEFVPLTITAEMLGHCLGEFAHTRKFVTHSAAGIGATRSSKAVSVK